MPPFSLMDDSANELLCFWCDHSEIAMGGRGGGRLTARVRGSSDARGQPHRSSKLRFDHPQVIQIRSNLVLKLHYRPHHPADCARGGGTRKQEGQAAERSTKKISRVLGDNTCINPCRGS